MFPKFVEKIIYFIQELIFALPQLYSFIYDQGDDKKENFIFPTKAITLLKKDSVLSKSKESITGPPMSTVAKVKHFNINWHLNDLTLLSGQLNERLESLVFTIFEKDTDLHFKLSLYPSGRENNRGFADENAWLTMEVIDSTGHWNLKVRATISDEDDDIVSNICNVNVKPKLSNFYQRLIIYDSRSLMLHNNNFLRESLFVNLRISVLSAQKSCEE